MERKELLKLTKPLMEKLDRMSTYLIITSTDALLVQEEQHAQNPKYERVAHKSDCAVNNGPAYEPGPCDCGAE